MSRYTVFYYKENGKRELLYDHAATGPELEEILLQRRSKVFRNDCFYIKVIRHSDERIFWYDPYGQPLEYPTRPHAAETFPPDILRVWEHIPRLKRRFELLRCEAWGYTDNAEIFDIPAALCLSQFIEKLPAPFQGMIETIMEDDFLKAEIEWEGKNLTITRLDDPLDGTDDYI